MRVLALRSRLCSRDVAVAHHLAARIHVRRPLDGPGPHGSHRRGGGLSWSASTVVGMSAEPVSSAPLGGGQAQPAAIRNQLSPELAEIFDREWEVVLERAKHSQDLQAIHDLLLKWRHIAAAEAKEPGWYFRLQEQAERILATGAPEPGSISGDEAMAMIAARLRDASPQD